MRRDSHSTTAAVNGQISAACARSTPNNIAMCSRLTPASRLTTCSIDQRGGVPATNASRCTCHIAQAAVASRLKATRPAAAVPCQPLAKAAAPAAPGCRPAISATTESAWIEWAIGRSGNSIQRTPAAKQSSASNAAAAGAHSAVRVSQHTVVKAAMAAQGRPVLAMASQSSLPESVGFPARRYNAHMAKSSAPMHAAAPTLPASSEAPSAPICSEVANTSTVSDCIANAMRRSGCSEARSAMA